MSCSGKPNVIIIEKDTRIIDQNKRLTQSIGIETLGGVFTPIINTGSEPPINEKRVFSTAVDNQDQITINIFRGNSQMAKNNTPIGKFRVVGILPAKRGTPQVEIAFGISNGDIIISAKDLQTNTHMVIEKQE